MKVTLKAFVYSLIFVLFGTAAKAQLTVPDSLRIAIGGEVLSATGNRFGTGVNIPAAGEAASAYSYGAGLSLRVDIPVLSGVLVTASAGYNRYFTTAKGANSQQAISNIKLPNFNTIPLKLGVKVFIGGDRFYGQAEVGETFLANKKALYAMYGNAFTWSPGFGIMFPLKKRHTYIDGGIRYESFQTFYNDDSKNGFWGLHVAYAFNLK